MYIRWFSLSIARRYATPATTADSPFKSGGFFSDGAQKFSAAQSARERRAAAMAAVAAHASPTSTASRASPRTPPTPYGYSTGGYDTRAEVTPTELLRSAASGAYGTPLSAGGRHTPGSGAFVILIILV